MVHANTFTSIHQMLTAQLGDGSMKGVLHCVCVMQVSLVLPTVQDTFGAGATYLGFAAIGVVAVATIYAIVPETKGKSLEEIEALFDLPGDEKSV